MAKRIEIASKVSDTRAEVRKRQLESAGFSLSDVQLVDVYTTDVNLDDSQMQSVSGMLSNNVFQEVVNGKKTEKFDYVVEIGFLPGVTDNVGNTAREGLEDLLEKKISGQGVYTSQMMFLSGDISREDAKRIGDSLSNPVIQRVYIKSYDEFKRDNGMGVIVPKVKIHEQPTADLVNILNLNDDELVVIGKQGIANSDGSRRGPLALDINYMKSIKEYFLKQGRNPTDVELESIAQTWSEHCKHTIFADSMDDIKDGLYETFIKASTNKIRKAKGKKDFCFSVFTDNSGVIEFDNKYLITDKVETHNSPSALDPFGGAITGIVGVNRDAIGVGLGAKPIVNRYGFCFANPEDKDSLYKGKDFTQKMLSARRIMDGVIEGVNVGGNCSGIPTPQGFVYFDEKYKGKPLVFVGTLGLLPKESLGRKAFEKEARPGDYVVMIGGRVGKDGIHGATFSSEAIDSGSPATAVQIGDPITQKKLSDAVVKEARDLGLYNSITDNGAGGLSCSVAEMAKESGGCYIQLDNVPLKYPGLKPWETWISESQERMTASVPKEKWGSFSDLMKRRGVEATIIGEFTDTGKCIVNYNGKEVMDVEMEFLHDGLPPRPMKTTFTKIKHENPEIPILEDLTDSFHSMLKRPNVTSFEFISQQYDHEVQGGSVIKPLQGRGRVNGDATIIKPVLDSNKGIVISQGINPSYSEIDTYNMAACAIDTAIRNSIAAGADLDHLALLDNFCWCSSNDPERLGQLKRAVKACYDYSIHYGTPFISGKDSMFNDFKGFDKDGKPVQISIPPTLLVSSLGIIDDVGETVSLDAKFDGDLVYLLGNTHDELGGSEYFSMIGEQQRGKKYIGNTVPAVFALRNKKLYRALSNCIDNGIIASSQSVNRGGLGVALAKTAMGGYLGMKVSLKNIPKASRDDFTLYSESQGRLVVTVNPKYEKMFEKIMGNNAYTKIGVVRKDNQFIVSGRDGKRVISTTIDDISKSYKSTFKEF